MNAWLSIQIGDPPERRQISLDQPSLSVGRSSRCNLRLPLAGISGHHLTIYRDAHRWFVVDQGSTNGTLLNDSALKPNQPAVLEQGATIDLHEVVLVFTSQPNRSPKTLTMSSTGELTRQLVGLFANSTGAHDTAYLHVRGPDAPQRASLPDGVQSFTVGASPENTLILPALEAPRLLEITAMDDGFAIRPVDITAPDLVHVERTPLVSRRRLRDENTIHVGPYQLSFHDPLESVLAEMDSQDSSGEQQPDSSPRKKLERLSFSDDGARLRPPVNGAVARSIVLLAAIGALIAGAVGLLFALGWF